MSGAAYLDPDREIDERIDDLLQRMSLQEKLNQLSCIWSSSLVENDTFNEEAVAERLLDGIGQITRIGANTGLQPQGSAAFANQIQRVLVEKSHLGIPAIIHEEALAGLCARGASQFPQAIGLAATFDPEAIRAMADVIRREMRAVGARQALAPVLDIARDPRWGRLEETYGEDPYLAGRMGVAYVRGLQGTDLRDGVLATGKHFLGYGTADGGLNHAPVQLGPRELREVYAEPFAAAIREANLKSVMNSYSSIDGVACAGSHEILQTLLRDELGFRGMVVADYYSIDLLIRHHRVAADKAEAAALAISAGMDVELPAQDCFGEPLAAQVVAGEIAESVVDRAVRRVLRAKFELGLFESPYVEEATAASVFDAPEHRALAARLAAESMVLLSNDGLLPLAAGMKVALLGPTADDKRLMLGDYNYPAHAEIVYKRESLPAAIAPASGSAFAPGPYYVPMVTVREALAVRTSVDHVAACGITDEIPVDLAAAVAAALAADVAVVCVGGKSGLLPDCTSGEFRDAANLELTGSQQDLLDAVVATGTPVVVVVIGGRAFALERLLEGANAVLLAWLPGEEGGSAIAETLFGENNPAGRLPISLPRSAGQLPVHYNYRAGGGRSTPLGDYIDESTKPLFVFGHGLSYSTFEYDDLQCPATVDTHGALTVSLSIANTSAVAGEEVVQLYIHDKVADVARPLRQLVGFERLTVRAGERCRVEFYLDISQLAYYNRDLEYVVDPGEIELLIGASSGDIRLRTTLMVHGEKRLLKHQQRVATQAQVVEI